MRGIRTVIWEKWIEFKHEWFKITSAALVSPLLYMIALGWGLGAHVEIVGHTYIDFLVPGIIALSTMNASFSAIGNSLSIQKIFEHSFEQIIVSPTPTYQFILGQSIGGGFRGLYAGTLILLVSIPFGTTMVLSPLFFIIMFLNSILFSSLGVIAAILASRHADVSRFSTFVILPMTFLCNTFFPLETVPIMVQKMIQILPLTHASGLLRGLFYGDAISLFSIFILLAYTALFILLSIFFINKRKNL